MNGFDNRAEKHDFPTKHEFKQICVFYIEQQKFDQNFSKNYFNELLRRIAPDYEVRLAQPVHYDRRFLTKKHLEDYFKTLKDIGIERICPQLIINLDETGFGGFKSGRMKRKKVIVIKSFNGPLRYQ